MQSHQFVEELVQKIDIYESETNQLHLSPAKISFDMVGLRVVADKEFQVTYGNIVSFGKNGLQAVLCLKGTNQIDEDDDEQGLNSLNELSSQNNTKFDLNGSLQLFIEFKTEQSTQNFLKLLSSNQALYNPEPPQENVLGFDMDFDEDDCEQEGEEDDDADQDEEEKREDSMIDDDSQMEIE